MKPPLPIRHQSTLIFLNCDRYTISVHTGAQSYINVPYRNAATPTGSVLYLVGEFQALKLSSRDGNIGSLAQG